MRITNFTPLTVATSLVSLNRHFSRDFAVIKLIKTMDSQYKESYDLENPEIDPKDVLNDLVAHIGWTKKEFVEATANYHPDLLEDYDWNEKLKELWLSTSPRIQSFLDLKYKFQNHNNWDDFILYGMGIFRHNIAKLGVGDEDEVRTPEELTDDLIARIDNNRKLNFPINQLEKDVADNILRLILTINAYFYDHPEEAYDELCKMRGNVGLKERRQNKRREANRLRKMNKKQHKKHK